MPLPPPPAAGSPEALARGRKAAETRAANKERAPIRGKSHHKKPAEPKPPTVAQQAPLRGPSKISAVRARNVKVTLTMAIAGLDMLAARVAPKAWTAEDRLEQAETALLVRGVYAELETLPKVLEWLARIAEQGVHAQLAMAVMAVAMPRLVRRNLVPVDVALAFAYAANLQQSEPEPDPVSVATGSAHQPDWDDGNGQVDVSGPPPVGTPIYNGVSVETR